MPETPTVDPALIAEIGKLTDEASAVLRQVGDLAERIGKVTDRYDEITDDLDDAAIDHLRYITGYDELLSTMFEITAHAAAGANDPTVGSLPDWYEQQKARRRERLLAKLDGADWTEEVTSV